MDPVIFYLFFNNVIPKLLCLCIQHHVYNTMYLLYSIDFFFRRIQMFTVLNVQFCCVNFVIYIPIIIITTKFLKSFGKKLIQICYKRNSNWSMINIIWLKIKKYILRHIFIHIHILLFIYFLIVCHNVKNQFNYIHTNTTF